jgi:hypothetical protein
MPDRLKAIEKRWSKVTEREWTAERERFSDLYAINAPFSEDARIEAQIGEMYSKDEARAVAAAPADVRWLIAEIKRLRGR